MMQRGRRDDQVWLGVGVASLPAFFHKQTPPEHDVFRDLEDAMREHRANLTGEPLFQFHAANLIGQSLDTETDFRKGYRADVEIVEEMRSIHVVTRWSGRGRRSSERTFVSSSHFDGGVAIRKRCPGQTCAGETVQDRSLCKATTAWRR